MPSTYYSDKIKIYINHREKIDNVLKKEYRMKTNILIEKCLAWKKVFLILLDNQRIEIDKIELSFNDKNIASVSIDLDKAKFGYLTNNIKCSHIVILSENLSCLKLSYNRRSKAYKIDLYVDGINDYGKIDTYVLKDQKNLFFRKDQSKIINVYTPSNYDKNKKYNVILMFDSHNIFDINKLGEYTENYDRYGGWQVEATLENIKKRYNEEFVVIGIDNSDEYRLTELIPRSNNWVIKSEIEAYFKTSEVKAITCAGHLDNLNDFINETLFPFVKENYSIKEDFMGICGSSCGGLASIYLGLKEINKYKFILSFTPAIGMVKEENSKAIYKDFISKGVYLPYVFYFQGAEGQLESLIYYLNQNFVNNLIESGLNKDKVDSYIELTASHNEDSWRYAFNFALEQVMKKCKNK